MKLKQFIATALIAGATLVSQPAAAYEITPTGQTRASPQLMVDVMRDISRYSKTNGGCSFLFSVRMAVMPRGTSAGQPAIAAERRGGHVERWVVNACAAKQMFQIAMWDSPRGGTDYVITPLTGRLPLTAM